jgi:tetratricopeptide (TPR) repeat protein
LGLVYKALHRWEEAEREFQIAVRLEPESPDHFNKMGTLYHDWGRLDLAISAFNTALEKNPTHVDALHNLALCLYHKAEHEAAHQLFLKAMDQEPQNIEFRRNFSLVHKHHKDDPELETLIKLHSDSSPSSTDRAKLCFSLGKAFEDFQAWEQGFPYYLEGNRLQVQGRAFEFERTQDEFERIAETFNEEFFRERTTWGISSPRPIFILGIPRSGTTLVEQILASHPQIFGAGEIPELGDILKTLDNSPETPYLDTVKALTQPLWEEMGEQYLQSLNLYDHQASQVINKMPGNFTFIAAIHLMFPHSVILNCQRSALDTCLSCFKHYFPMIHPYACNLYDMGLYYRLYLKLMSHWRGVLPQRILDIQYEELVAHPKSCTRTLLQACGQEFHEDCLKFHESKRPVKTASSAQVRKPVYNSSIGTWKRYEKFLGPLIEGLTTPISGLPTVEDIPELQES